MVLFEDIVKVLHWSVPTTAAQSPFLLYIGDGCAVDGRQIRVDDARLRMGLITQCLAKQSFGCVGVTQRGKQKINGGTGRIDGPIQVTPAALHANVGLVHAPGLVGGVRIHHWEPASPKILSPLANGKAHWSYTLSAGHIIEQTSGWETAEQADVSVSVLEAAPLLNGATELDPD